MVSRDLVPMARGLPGGGREASRYRLRWMACRAQRRRPRPAIGRDDHARNTWHQARNKAGIMIVGPKNMTRQRWLTAQLIKPSRDRPPPASSGASADAPRSGRGLSAMAHRVS
jgi:hypothetical protein